MTSAIFAQAFREYSRFRRVAPWIALAALCYGLAIAWPQLIPNLNASERYASISSILCFHILALASAIFTTAIVSQEVEGRTIVYLLTRPVPRWRLLLTRYAASVLVVAILGVFMVCVTSVGSSGTKAAGLLTHDIEAVLVGAAAYGALFLLVSLMLNRAMIYCLLFAFGWETSVPSMPGDLYHLSIYSYMQSIAQHPVTENTRGLMALAGGANVSTISVGAAYVTMAALVIGCLALGSWWFTHFEYVPREDAE
jgi:ABC-2 type transport system permease protein